MAKNKAIIDDAVFDDEEVDVPDVDYQDDDDYPLTRDDEPQQQAKPDEEEEEDDAPAEPPAAAAPEEDDGPPSEPPSDPAYLLAQSQQRQAELEARLAAQEEMLQRLHNPPDADERAERELVDKLTAQRQQVMAAVREGDEAQRMEAMFALQDTEEALRQHRSQRELRQLRQMRGEPEGQQQPRISAEQAREIESNTFRSVHRVTPEEEAQMAREWSELVKRNPAWAAPSIRRWDALQKALDMVRSGKKPPKRAAHVEGGQSRPAPGGRKSALDKYDARELSATAKMMGMTLEQAAEFIKLGESVRG